MDTIYNYPYDGITQRITVKIKKLTPSGRIPAKATVGAAAYDIYTPRDYVVAPGRQVLPLDIAIELPEGYEAKIEPRSGYSAKGMEGMLDGVICRFDADVLVGKIDSDYRGNVGVIVKSYTRQKYVIPAGTRIAQLTIYRALTATFIESDELSATDRGDGGFGHTNEKAK